MRSQHFHEGSNTTYNIEHVNPGEEGDHHYQAFDPDGNVVGNMLVSPNLRWGGGKIQVVNVDNAHQRRGVATAMGQLAGQQWGRLQHTARTGQGEAWAKAFDEKTGLNQGTPTEPTQ